VVVPRWYCRLVWGVSTKGSGTFWLPPSISVTPAIPKLHEPMHTATNHQVYSLNFIPGVGASDFECPERFWAGHNALSNATKTQGPGSRQDVLDNHFNFWNWQKYVGMGSTLMRKYKAALAERNIQLEGHRGLTTSLDATLVVKWEAMCSTWEKASLPKKVPNPYDTDRSSKHPFFLLIFAGNKQPLPLQTSPRRRSGGS
jgi:hypothetical protein